MSAEYNPFVQRHTPDAEAVSDREASSAGSSASPLFPATPVYARKRKSSNIGKVALFAVPAAILLAGAAVMLAQPRSSDLFAETTAVPPTLAPAAMPNPVTEVADAAPASQPAPARRAVRRAAATPAPASVADSPETWASDASARIPDAPIPYSPSAQAPVPAPVVTPPIAPSMTEPPAAPSVETPAQESPGEPTP